MLLLEAGEVTVLGLLPYSSNYTFLAKVSLDQAETHAVYKPRRGERPLWDFAHGSLAGREVAAYLVSAASGWSLVPPTVLREDAPLGPGSLQQFVQHDPERHYFTLMEERAEELRRFAAFDAVINNADRKAGHVIEDASGKLWAVDHGVSFHVQPKLRTVIWSYAEEPLGSEVRAVLEQLGAQLGERSELRTGLASLITPDEIDATLDRIETLLLEDRFPAPGTDRPLPWPLI
ncbi:MAG TPA: SCO1664 family protein [Actinomycetota bacterium]|nr:SCO1664 family protein [Actinomycetota bacterium]